DPVTAAHDDASDNGGDDGSRAGRRPVPLGEGDGGIADVSPGAAGDHPAADMRTPAAGHVDAGVPSGRVAGWARCPGGTLGSGVACRNSICVLCGNPGDPCVTCGATGSACCPGNSCASPAAICLGTGTAAKCVDCGMAGAVCCPGKICRDGGCCLYTAPSEYR